MKPPKQETAQAQRRTTQRVPFGEEVQIHVRTTVTGRGVDIGAGGIGLLVPIELPVGKTLDVAILGGAATAYGTVRWVKKEEEGWRLGIQFRKEDWAIMELIDGLRSQEG